MAAADTASCWEGAAAGEADTAGACWEGAAAGEADTAGACWEVAAAEEADGVSNDSCSEALTAASLLSSLALKRKVTLGLGLLAAMILES